MFSSVSALNTIKVNLSIDISNPLFPSTHQQKESNASEIHMSCQRVLADRAEEWPSSIDKHICLEGHSNAV